MRDALARVKADLGPSAIILSTQRIDDGAEGHGFIEVTATSDTADGPEPAQGLHFFQRTSRGRAPMPLEPRLVSTSAPRVSGLAASAPQSVVLAANLGGASSVAASSTAARSTAEACEDDLVARLQGLLAPLVEEVRDLRSRVDLATQSPQVARIRPGQAPEPIEVPAPAALRPPSLAPERASGQPASASAGDVGRWWDEAGGAEAPRGGGREAKVGGGAWLPVDNMLTRLSQEEGRPGVGGSERGLERSDEVALEGLRRNLMGVNQARALVRDPIELLKGWLSASEVAPDRRAALVEGVRLRLEGEALTRDAIERAFVEELLSRVQIRDRRALEGRRVVALVGPTGVGKTTTLAKMAAEARLDRRRSVGLVTIDTYRIGAVDQLRKYASLLEIPLEVVVDRISLERSLRRFEHCDLVLIDTIGRSPRDEEPVRRLAELFEGLAGLSFDLCVSATTALRDMQGIARNFQRLAPESVLFTKLDEAFAVGPLLSSHLDTNIPLSYFTTGQSVPEDIEHASVERLLGMIMPLVD